MKKFKVKIIFTLLFAFTFFFTLTCGNVFAVTKQYVRVYLTVEDSNGKKLENGEKYTHLKPGDVISVSAYCLDDKAIQWSQDEDFMNKKGYVVNKDGMALLGHMFDSTDSKNYITSKSPTKLEITIPPFEENSKHILCINAIAAVDGLIDGDKEYEAGSMFAIGLTIPKKDLNGNLSLICNNKILSNGGSMEILVGDKVTIKGEPASNFSSISGKWIFESGKENNISILGATETLVIPGREGQKVKLELIGTLKDGTKTSTITYTFKIPIRLTDPIPTPDLKEDSMYGDIIVRLNNKVLQNNCKVSILEDEILSVVGMPTSNFEAIKYRWDKGEYETINGNVAQIDVFPKEGEVHEIKIYGLLKDGGKTTSKTYYFITEEPDELIVEPWMRENKDSEGLLVSLRNDSEVDKANKNFYTLNEEIIYYVDYKNCGKKIENEVNLKLKLPLKFDVVEYASGTISKIDKTITWTFEEGLDEGESGTKTVIIKYKELSNKSYDYEIVYPQVKIYKNNRVMDTSASMNYIYLNEATEIKDEHSPYMFGDKDKPTFRPDDTISRAEGALVLTRIFGINIENAKITDRFSDISETFPEAQKAIMAASDLGIINGYDDGTYRPKAKMTRAEFMKIIASYIEVTGEENNIDGLEIKENQIKVYKNTMYREHWSLNYVTLLTRLNMTSVSEKNKDLRLNDEITRAEVAQLVNFYAFRAPAEVTTNTKIQFTDVPKNHELYADIIEATRDIHTYSITEKGLEKKK